MTTGNGERGTDGTEDVGVRSRKRGVGEAFLGLTGGKNVTTEDEKGFSALPDCPYGGAGRTISRHETGFSARRKSPFGSAGKAIRNDRKA